MGSPLLFLMALNMLQLFMAINAQCQYEQDIFLGEKYYIFNEEYPNNYPKGTNCRWSARSEFGTQIVLTCEQINIPQSPSCQYDKLSISLTGNKNFADAHNYCGNGSISLVSVDNLMEIGLFSSIWGPDNKDRRFVCTVTAIQGSGPTTTTTRPVTCDCGWKQGMRIVGGHETGINEYPFMSGVVDVLTAVLYCGASIISNRYALTAAHCLTNKEIGNVALLVGDHNISTGTDTPYARVYKIMKFIIHEDFDYRTQNNDVGIIKTATAIVFSPYVGPVCLPFRFSRNDFIGSQVIALGWGSEEFSGPRSDVLQEVTLNVISNKECSRSEKNLTDNQMCTSTPNKDTCQSDSGGPLVYMANNIRRLHLVGIINFGMGCATLRPSVNARVTRYISWIVTNTPDTDYCIR